MTVVRTPHLQRVEPAAAVSMFNKLRSATLRQAEPFAR
jgi:hypothetical protein